MTDCTFDRVGWQRERIRALDAEVDSLRSQRAKLERILCVALRVAVANGCDPLVLLDVIEEIDASVIASEQRHEKALRVLRDTNSAGRTGRRDRSEVPT